PRPSYIGSTWTTSIVPPAARCGQVDAVLTASSHVSALMTEKPVTSEEASLTEPSAATVCVVDVGLPACSTLSPRVVNQSTQAFMTCSPSAGLVGAAPPWYSSR